MDRDGFFTWQFGFLRASSELPKVTSTVLRCLDTSGCEGHFLDSCLQKAGGEGGGAQPTPPKPRSNKVKKFYYRKNLKGMFILNSGFMRILWCSTEVGRLSSLPVFLAQDHKGLWLFDITWRRCRITLWQYLLQTLMLGFWLPCWFNRQRCIKLLYSLALGCPTLTGFAKEGLRILASLPTCAHAPFSHHPHLTSFSVIDWEVPQPLCLWISRNYLKLFANFWKLIANFWKLFANLGKLFAICFPFKKHNIHMDILELQRFPDSTWYSL